MDNFTTKMVGLLYIVMLCFVVYIFVDFLELQNVKKANEQLKKEKYECKQELDKYKEKYLNIVVNN